MVHFCKLPLQELALFTVTMSAVRQRNVRREKKFSQHIPEKQLKKSGKQSMLEFKSWYWFVAWISMSLFYTCFFQCMHAWTIFIVIGFHDYL